MNHQGLLSNVHCVATVVLRKQLNFKSAVIRSNRSSCCVLDSSRDVFSRSVSDSVCNVMGTYSTCDCALFYPTGGWRKKYSRIFKEELLKRIKLHTPRLQISKPLTLLTMTDPTPSCHHCYSEGYHVGPSKGHQPCLRQVLSRSSERDINHLVTFYTNV